MLCGVLVCKHCRNKRTSGSSRWAGYFPTPREPIGDLAVLTSAEFSQLLVTNDSQEPRWPDEFLSSCPWLLRLRLSVHQN